MQNPLKATTDLAIDLGTVNTLICNDRSQVLLNEPTTVTVNHRLKCVEAVGTESRRMLGRTPSHLEVIWPLRDGVIDHFDLTQEMLHRYLKRVSFGRGLFGSHLVICVPTETTQIERRAVRETGLALKASEVHVVEEPMAAACGAGLNVSEPRGVMVVDVGGGTTEIAVISFAGIVCSGSVRVGGTHMDEAIVQHVRRRHNMLIGHDTAERLKLEVGCAARPNGPSVTAQVRGRDLVTQLPKVMYLRQEDVYEAIADQVRYILSAVRRTLERTPPELSGDIIRDGITLTGGGAMLTGLAQQIAKECGLNVNIAESPLLAVALGASKLLKNRALLERVQLKGL